MNIRSALDEGSSNVHRGEQAAMGSLRVEPPMPLAPTGWRGVGE